MAHPLYQDYEPFVFDHDDIVVCARHENVTGWQTYHDEKDAAEVWTVIITTRHGDSIRSKMPKEAARECLAALSDAIVTEAKRNLHNANLTRKENSGGR